VNPALGPDIVDACLARVRRQIEEVMRKLWRGTVTDAQKRERLFAGLADIVEDLQRKSLAEEDATVSVEKRKAESEVAT
jgi:hypothetical protein